MKRKNDKIKILYLVTELKTGGVKTLILGLVKKLDRKKFEPVVVSITPIAEIGKKIEEEGVKVLSLSANFKYIRYSPLIVLRLISIINKEKPEILHSHIFSADFLGRIIGKFCKVPIIISTIHNEKFGREFYEKLLKYTEKFCDMTTIVSQNVAKVMVEKKVVSEGRFRVIYNGIELNSFNLDKDLMRKKIRSELNLKENQKVLISVGRLTEQKGYPCLIEAFNNLIKKYPDLALIILGEGEDREKLEREVKIKNLKENISFLRNKDNVPEYLAASDVFVSSSLWEGLPLSILEAMASRLPVIATQVGGVPEIIKEGETGFLVEPKNSKALAEKIGYLLSLPQEERKKVGEKGRKLVEEKFTLDKMVKSYENLYEEFCTKRNNTK